MNESTRDPRKPRCAVCGSCYLYAGTFGSGAYFCTNKTDPYWVKLEYELTRDFILPRDIDNNDRIYAGTFGGVFYLDPGSAKWRLEDYDLAFRNVMALAVIPYRGVFVGTLGGGVYRSNTTVTGAGVQ
jgi:hypothetical protein